MKIKPSRLFNKSGLNKIFVSPAFSPNTSLEKFINGIGSPSVLPSDNSSKLNKISPGKISINGPIFLYLPGKEFNF